MRGVHGAHVELVIQQVRVPRQTPAARDRGSRHPPVICAPAVVALRVQVCRHPPPTQSSQTRLKSNSAAQITGLLPLLWNQAGTSLHQNIFPFAPTTKPTTAEHNFSCSLMSSPAVIYLSHAGATAHLSAIPSLTNATVGPAVATSAVTHLLAGGHDQAARAIILTWVRAAHWKHTTNTDVSPIFKINLSVSMSMWFNLSN